MKNNNPDYTHYVVTHGKIESGWEDKDDAKEQIKDNMHPKMAAGAKVVAKSALNSRHGLDPENNDHWHTAASTKSICEAVEQSAMQMIAEGNLYDFGRSVKADLSARAQFVISECDKAQLLKDARALKEDSAAGIARTFNAPDNTHFVIGRGKIISGHSNIEAAQFRHSRLPLSVQRESKVVSRDQLPRLFNPNDNSQWAHPHEIREWFGDEADAICEAISAHDDHFVVAHGKIMMGRKSAEDATHVASMIARNGGPSGTVHSRADLHKVGLDANRAEHWHNPEDAHESSGLHRIHEMHDFPDQEIAALSRAQVERIVNRWKRSVAPSQNNDSVEAHSTDGKARTNGGEADPADEPANKYPGHA